MPFDRIYWLILYFLQNKGWNLKLYTTVEWFEYLSKLYAQLCILIKSKLKWYYKKHIHVYIIRKWEIFRHTNCMADCKYAIVAISIVFTASCTFYYLICEFNCKNL